MWQKQEDIVNKERRATARLCIELIKECAEIGEMREASHEALVEAVKLLRASEYWGLHNSLKHEGENPATDKNIAVSRVALPALDAATVALEEGDYNDVIDQLTLVVTTDGGTPEKSSGKGLRKGRK